MTDVNREGRDQGDLVEWTQWREKHRPVCPSCRLDDLPTGTCQRMWMPSLSPKPEAHPGERIVAAALQYDGLVFSMPPPARHGQIARSMNGVGIMNVKPDACREQGFLTSLGRYVSREEGCLIAREAGQLANRTKTGAVFTLFSEDLW
jgi:hypothetical protein